jgi:hypothetical protein
VCSDVGGSDEVADSGESGDHGGGGDSGDSVPVVTVCQ